MSVTELTPESFQRQPAVLEAVRHPRSPRSVLNYMCGCDTADPANRARLSRDETIGPLLGIWFQSGTALDGFCQPFAVVVRELKASPPSLIGSDWDSLEGRVAKALLADQLSRACFRGTAEAFSYDPIARGLVRGLMSLETRADMLKLPAALLYLLPWALAHSEELADLDRACDLIDMSIEAYPTVTLFKERNKPAVEQHRQVLRKFGRYPQRNTEFGRESTVAERAWLDDKDNLPIWAGGRASFDQAIT